VEYLASAAAADWFVQHWTQAKESTFDLTAYLG